MSKKTTGIIAGAAGAALLIGGGTFALWSDSASINNNTLTTGNLDIVAAACATEAGNVVWTDISPNRSDINHTITASTWRGVPGDVIQGEFCFSGALEGDNLVAQLAPVAPTSPTDGWYTVSSKTQILVGTTWTDLASPYTVTSLDNPQKGSLPTLPAVVGAANVKVVVTVTINNVSTPNGAPGTEGNAPAAGTINLGNLSASLTQTRTAGAGGGF